MKNLASSFNEDEKKGDDPLQLTRASLIFAPLFFGGRHRGTSMGPEALRAAGLESQLDIAGITVARTATISVPDSNCFKAGRCPEMKVKCGAETEAVCREIMAEVEAALEADSVAVTIGGDHSLAIGTIAGTSSYFGKRGARTGLIWFDAHGDIHTPETSYNGNLHAMPLAATLGRGDKRLVELGGFFPKVLGSNAVLIGLSDLDGAEREMIAELGVTAFTMHDIDRLGIARVMERAIEIASEDTAGIHVSFDIDVMDSEYAPGVGTPSYGGMHVREAHHALSLLFETGLVRALDMVEVNPAFDVRNRTASLAVALIRTALGHRVI